MKKLLALVLCLVTPTCWHIKLRGSGCHETDSCDFEHSGQTYFAVPPQFQSASPELISSFRPYQSRSIADKKGGALQVVLFGSHSSDNKNLQRYFTPFGKTKLTVSEIIDPSNKSDLHTQHFNIFTKTETFSSTISFEPQESTIGLGSQYRHSFWYNEETNRNWFFSISSSLVRIKNTFDLIEIIHDDGGGADQTADKNVVANMMQAFKQEEWKYGRIGSNETSKGCTPCPQIKTGLADIDIKLGMEWINNESCHLESYTGLLIPTGNTPTGEHVFEPIIGYGRYAGITFGSSGSYDVWCSESSDRILRAECTMHSVYLFSSPREKRAIDLQNKPFSRYMEVYADKEQATEAFALQKKAESIPGGPEQLALFKQAANLATPGINVFTLPVKVTPGFQFNMTTALTLACPRGFQLEGGYNFYARRAECVRLACPWKLGPALKKDTGKGETNPARDITTNVFLNNINIQQTGFDYYDDNLIQQSDLNLNSAAQPAGIAHTFYGSLGYECDQRRYPVMGAVGGSYQFANGSNAMLDRWTLWAKMGIYF